MKIGIIGFGHVGGAMKELFKDAIVYDKIKNIGTQEEINACDVAFICVPTPPNSDGSCNTSIVEEVISWCKAKVLILGATIRIGFTDEMIDKNHKEIVFQPEYYGETIAHPFANLSDRKWLTFGGSKRGIDLAIKAYQTVLNADVSIYQSTSKEAEMAKYMENAFFATKVIFCNEMFDICTKLGIDYNMVRELWTADPRIGKYHTFVYENERGFGGRCLPKDISSLRQQGIENGLDMTLTNAVIEKNAIVKGEK